MRIDSTILSHELGEGVKVEIDTQRCYITTDSGDRVCLDAATLSRVVRTALFTCCEHWYTLTIPGPYELAVTWCGHCGALRRSWTDDRWLIPSHDMRVSPLSSPEGENADEQLYGEFQ